MRVLLLLLCSFVVCAELGAAPAETRCYVGEEGSFIANPQPFDVDTSINGKIPEIIEDEKNKMTGLHWVPQADGTTSESGKVGEFQGRTIYRFVYHAKAGNEDGVTGPLCTLFAYQSSEAGNNSQFHLRPFFLLVGDDQLDSVEWYFESSKGSPFSLYIQQNMKGNGVYWSSYSFVFTSQQTWLEQRSEGGRKMHTKTYSYDRRGKVTSTKVESSE